MTIDEARLIQIRNRAIKRQEGLEWARTSTKTFDTINDIMESDINDTIWLLDLIDKLKKEKSQ